LFLILYDYSIQCNKNVNLKCIVYTQGDERKMKKIVSLLLLFTLVLSIGATSFAGANLGNEDFEVTPNLGGGPSPSAIWTKDRIETKVVDIDTVNDILWTAEQADKADATEEEVYDLMMILAGYMNIPMATGVNVASYFGSTFDIPRDTVMNMLPAQGYLRYYGPGSVITIEYPVYKREATSEELVGAPEVKSSTIIDNWDAGMYN